MRTVVVLATALAAHAAHAESSIELTLNADGQDVARRMGLDVPAFVEQSRQRIDDLFRISGTSKLLEAFANVAAFAQRGIGVDYDPDPRDILFGVTATGFRGDIAVGSSSSYAGSSINATAMVGVNLGRWDTRGGRSTRMASISTRPCDRSAAICSRPGCTGSLRVVMPRPPGPARWMGVVVTSGIEHARWKVGVAQTLETQFLVVGSLGDGLVHMNSTGTLEVDVSTLGIPLEVSTAIRLGNVVTPYVGVGMELATGSSDVNVALDSALSVNDERLPIGTARITNTDSRSPDAVKLHAFGGLQFHTRHVRIATQAAVQDGAYSVALALRFGL